MLHDSMFKAELDSHADTCTFGRSAYICEDTGNTVSVQPFIGQLGKLHKVPIVTAAIAYDCQLTYQTYILYFPQSLYIKDLEHHLLCPNQIRHHQIQIHDIPLKYIPSDQRTHEDHSIIAEDPERLHIPLKLDGTTSYFETRKPRQSEMQPDSDTIKIFMTSDSQWDPMDELNANDEDAIRASFNNEAMCGRTYDISSIRTSAGVDIGKSIALRTAASVSTRSRKGAVDSDTLAKRWKIGHEAAKRTVERTTQLAVRNFEGVTGDRRLKPYSYQLRYRMLNVEMYTDTFFGKVKSLKGNTCAQIYCTPFHWITAEPMQSKKEAHKTLDSLFRKVGVPRVIIPDNARELTQGEFKKKVQRVGATIRPIEAYTPNANIAEDGIRELKQTCRRMTSSMNTPEVLWDSCLVFCAHIRSNTAMNIHALHGDVPAAVLTGDTPDISYISEFGWYEYVWYISPQGTDTLQRKQLGRYCGPSHDVGDALCAEILTDKALLVSRTSVIPLSLEETNSDVIKKKKQDYEESLKKHLGKRYEVSKDDETTATPDFTLYKPTNEDEVAMEELLEADDIQHAT